ncbi:hypothetical protein PsorP6_011460 [Peronosclerospora sorghi]|uniref:Uncharacterized protein n=1 Tax=Peronosclerospora sorghi TaxID=230839 RepID=A0ACC0WLA8_9STRA|nr:hypothetical protein PsorP6_011460 [Peronosclerospora sorghi]
MQCLLFHESYNLSIHRLSLRFFTELLTHYWRLEHGPDKTQYVSLQDYRENLQQIMHMVQPLLTPYGRTAADHAAQVRMFTCWTDLHTNFNTTYPDETISKTYFVNELHFSEKGNREVFKRLGFAINGMFDYDVLDKFSRWQDWHDLVYHA